MVARVSGSFRRRLLALTLAGLAARRLLGGAVSADLLTLCYFQYAVSVVVTLRAVGGIDQMCQPAPAAPS